MTVRLSAALLFVYCTHIHSLCECTYALLVTFSSHLHNRFSAGWLQSVRPSGSRGLKQRKGGRCKQASKQARCWLEALGGSGGEPEAPRNAWSRRRVPGQGSRDGPLAALCSTGGLPGCETARVPRLGTGGAPPAEERGLPPLSGERTDPGRLLPVSKAPSEPCPGLLLLLKGISLRVKLLK